MANSNRDWRRDRRPRRRGFDDDAAPSYGGGTGWPSPPSRSSDAPPPRRHGGPVPGFGPEVGAVVKRFDAERGFGFVRVEDGAGNDAFLNVSALQRAGADAVAPGQRLRVRVGQGQKGPQVTEVLEVGEVDDAALAAAAAAPRARSDSHAAPSLAEAQEVRGTVKWYSAEKGFGFVGREDGGRDVFVHASALARGGVASLAEGQAVVLRVVQGKKGPEAASVSPA
jgi:CspA family cold shock protein